MTAPQEINHTTILSSRFQLLVGGSDLFLEEGYKIATPAVIIWKLTMTPLNLYGSLYFEDHMKYSHS